jgi:hypothetical protein
MRAIPDNARILFMLSAQGLTPDGLEQLSRLHQLRFLRLNRTAHGDAALKALTDHPSLEKLMLWTDEGITSKGVRQLSTVKSLRSLEFSSVELDVAALQAMPKQLEHLTISNCNIADKGIAALPTFPQLTSVKLKNSQLTDTGLIAFVQRHPGLEDVTVDVASDRFLDALVELPNLERLWLGGSPITSDGWQTIGRLDGLERLWVSSVLTDDARARIKQLPNPNLDYVSHLGKYIYLERGKASP